MLRDTRQWALWSTEHVRRHHETPVLVSIVSERESAIPRPAREEARARQVGDGANRTTLEIDNLDLVAAPARLWGVEGDVASVPREVRLRPRQSGVEDIG